MSTIGRFTNSLLSASNENTLALANLNFDFTLFKFEAPREFRTIGKSLSLRRRDDAEQGKIHKTARKLGALFEALVPSTPNLLKAYGTRSSEIASNPDANPKGSKDHGAFADFVGIDGSSLWAAATSGIVNAGTHAALSMHLLACMLARAWEADKAISIWAELITERQVEIAKSMEDAPQFMSTCMAARQDITREELAKWDASARAWLQSADGVKERANKQMMLIVKNICVNVGEGKTTYQNVIDVWRHALLGMEDLVQGRPQEASNGSVLLALSAWHIYPDLMVLGSSTKSVEFHDPLVQAGGVVTIGLQYISKNEDMGMHWSLTLSQYRFYDREAKVESRDGTDRVSMDELLTVALGSLFWAWQVSRDEEIRTANWLVKLDDLVRKSASFPWLRVLASASRKFLALNMENAAHCSELITWGRRRAKNFLGFELGAPDPFFGLRRSPLLQALSLEPGMERGISHLRAVAQAMNIRDAKYVIRYQDQAISTSTYGYCTALPHRRISLKRSLDGSVKYEEIHYAWLPTEGMPTKIPSKRSLDEFLIHKETLYNHIPAMNMTPCVACLAGTAGCDGTCSPYDTPYNYIPPKEKGPCFACLAGTAGCDGACRSIESLGCPFDCSFMPCRHLVNSLPRARCIQFDWFDIGFSPGSLRKSFLWRNPPALMRNHLGSGEDLDDSCCVLLPSQAECTCAYPCSEDEFQLAKFNLCYGDPYSFALYIQVPVGSKIDTDQHKIAANNASNSRASIEEAITLLDERKLNIQSLSQYLIHYDKTHCDLLNHGQCMVVAYTRDIANLLSQSHLNNDNFTALAALAVAETTYASLKGCTVPLQAASMSLCTAKWSMAKKASDKFCRRIDTRTTLAARFACIVSFESCSDSVGPWDCEQIIAVSFGNSIFVASCLLSDPSRLGACTNHIQRLTGNVGMSGISLMIVPNTEPKVRALGHKIRLVPHNVYDHNRENNFQGTSLHLSFTNWRRPFDSDNRGTIDEPIFYVETVVSVHDRGEWVADIDIISIFDLGIILLAADCHCHGEGAGVTTAVDSWEEVLDRPENVAVVRAHGNWAARLAVLAVCHNQSAGDVTIVDPRASFCPKCIPANFVKRTMFSTGLVID